MTYTRKNCFMRWLLLFLPCYLFSCSGGNTFADHAEEPGAKETLSVSPGTHHGDAMQEKGGPVSFADTTTHTWAYARIFPAYLQMGADTLSHPWKGSDASVLDYYLNLPAKYLVNDSNSAEQEKRLDVRSGKLKLVDQASRSTAYLRLVPCEAFAWEGEIQLALFREAPAHEPILGIFRYDCGPGCAISYRFMKFRNNKWLDVTDSTWKLEEQLPYANFEKEIMAKAGDEAEFHLDLWPQRNSFTINDQNLFSGEKGHVLCTFLLRNGTFIVSNRE
jgi:hypothetical protein